jgi:hypothetical protein
MKCCFEGFEETPSEDGIILITHFHYIKSMYSVRVLEGLPKDTGREMEPIGSFFLPPKPYRDFGDSFSWLLLRPFCSKVERNNIFA